MTRNFKNMTSARGAQGCIGIVFLRIFKYRPCSILITAFYMLAKERLISDMGHLVKKELKLTKSNN